MSLRRRKVVVLETTFGGAPMTGTATQPTMAVASFPTVDLAGQRNVGRSSGTIPESSGTAPQLDTNTKEIVKFTQASARSLGVAALVFGSLLLAYTLAIIITVSIMRLSLWIPIFGSVRIYLANQPAYILPSYDQITWFFNGWPLVISAFISGLMFIINGVSALSYSKLVTLRSEGTDVSVGWSQTSATQVPKSARLPLLRYGYFKDTAVGNRVRTTIPTSISVGLLYYFVDRFTGSGGLEVAPLGVLTLILGVITLSLIQALECWTAGKTPMGIFLKIMIFLGILFPLALDLQRVISLIIGGGAAGHTDQAVFVFISIFLILFYLVILMADQAASMPATTFEILIMVITSFIILFISIFTIILRR